MIKMISIFFSFLFLLCSNHFAQNKILIVTGGKSFEKEAFFEIFSNINNLGYDTISKPAAFNIFSSSEISKYKAIVFYDAFQPITEDQKSSFLNLFDKGIGCVFIHHALVSHQDWEEYEKILGGRYHHKAYKDDGKGYGPSTYKHDQDLLVKILDQNHPVTKGMQDFPIHDEIYINFKIHDFVKPLLSLDNCENGKYAGWTNNYKNSKIVYIQLGHDHAAYENSNYRILIKNAIEWAAE